MLVSFGKSSCIDQRMKRGYVGYFFYLFPCFYVLTHSGLPQVGQRLLEDLDVLPDCFAFFSCAEYAFATDFPVFFVVSFLSFHFLVVVVVVVIVCLADISYSYSAIHRCTDRRLLCPHHHPGFLAPLSLWTW